MNNHIIKHSDEQKHIKQQLKDNLKHDIDYKNTTNNSTIITTFEDLFRATPADEKYYKDMKYYYASMDHIIKRREEAATDLIQFTKNKD